MEGRNIEDAIVMDKKTFKSLTSETRIKILKLLKERNHTITEISEKLGISKAAAKEHIEILIEGRLVELVSSSNIWKYYKLTDDGKKLVKEEAPQRVVILIATAIIGLLMMLYGFSYYFLPQEEITKLETNDDHPIMLARSMEPQKEIKEQKEDSIRVFFGYAGILLILLAIFGMSKKRWN